MKVIQTRSRIILASVASIVLLCAGSLVSFGQESRATLSGKVTDPTNAVVSGATVTVTSVETSVVHTAKTNESGEWRVQALNPGHYSFEVKATGFKSVQHSAIELQVGDQKTADVQLQVGAVTETVDVATEGSLIDTDAAVSGTVITTKELEELPSQSQVPTLLAGLTPGVVVGNGVSGGVYLWSTNGASQIQENGSGSVAGSGAQNSNAATQYRLDGAYDSSSGGTIGFIPPQDSISEFRVTSNAYDASIGRQSGATIDMVSKTGTKDFHGSLYEYNLNNFLNAKTWGNSFAPAVHTNQFGGTVGGPIWIPHLYDGRKRKTFFFFSYAGIHNTAPVNTGFMTVPSLLERKGDFSQTCFVTSGIIYGTGGGCTTTKTPVPATQPFTVYDPATIDPTTGNRTAFFQNAIPSGRISTFATAILALIPPPDRAPDLGISSDANNFVKKEVQRDLYHGYTVRLDQAWNNSNHSYANISRNSYTEASFNPFGGFANDVLNSFNQARKQQIFTLDHNVVLNPRMVLDLKYSVLNTYGNAFSPSAHFDASSLGLSSNYISQMPEQGIPLFTGLVNGAEQGGLGTANGGSYTTDTFQTIDVDLTHSYRSHTFKYGFEHLIQQNAGGNPAASAGSFSFGSATNTSADSWTCLNPVKNCGASQGNGSNVAQFLLGLPTSGSISTNPTAFWSQHYTAAYFQDNWRVTSKLTLDLGLRWDFQTGVTERHNKNYTRYDPTYVQTAVTTPSQASYATLVGTPSTNIGVNLLQAYRPSASTFIATGAIGYSGVHGTPRTLYNPRYLYFQPRLGFAYRFHPRTVLRGGLGRFAQASFDTDSQNGYSATTNYTATSDNFYHGYTNPITGTVSSLLNPYPDGLTAPTGNSLAEQTNIGSVTSYT
ncbi:MAG: carboxypeptidase regulatory-like domain-containing protein, partial [Acidobacteriota bacterium]|nr:carboxypeptidase regulatory-like domain-containing protein [Acidobacteriota bacterium]